jgi:hypothetical protein
MYSVQDITVQLLPGTREWFTEFMASSAIVQRTMQPTRCQHYTVQNNHPIL